MKTGNLRTASLVLMATVLTLTLAGCGQQGNTKSDTASQQIQPQPVATSDPGDSRRTPGVTFSSKDLVGSWSILSTGNANSNFSWILMKLNIDANGRVQCIDYNDNHNRSSCSAVGDSVVFNMLPEGVITAENGSIYGLMDYDKTSAHLFAQGKDGVNQTLFMSRESGNSTMATMAGEWSGLLLDNGNKGFGWAYVKMLINRNGETDCLTYFDSKGNYTCEGVNLPTLSLSADGLLAAEGASTYGLLNLDRTTAYLATVGGDGVEQTGVLVKTGNFTAANLAGRWAVMVQGNGNPDSGWLYLQLNITREGLATCLNYSDSKGGSKCSAIGKLPNFSITPNGVISTQDKTLYGLMGLYGGKATLITVTGDGVTQTGFMSRR